MALTEKELIKLGIDPDDLTYPFGEFNIIVNCFAPSADGLAAMKAEDNYEVYPDIYMPRKNEVYSCGATGNEGISLNTEAEKQDHIAHLKDSAARLKIMAYYLEKQVKEMEEFGMPKTTLYYPE